MVILLTLSGFIFAALVALLYEYKLSQMRKETTNRVHFYVARDKSGMLYFYPTKPIRKIDYFIPNDDKISFTFKGFNGDCFNTKKFDNLKWEDEPVEVFLNMEG